MNKIFVFGPAGTFGHQAGMKAARILEPIHGSYEVVFCGSHDEIFERTLSGEGIGILPIENNYAGPVDGVAEKFRSFYSAGSLFVVGGVSLPVQHHLLVRPGVMDMRGFMVHSHDQPLLQCRETLRRMQLNKLKGGTSTAEAARRLSLGELGNDAAVIGSALAAETYGLTILIPNVEDRPTNTTRFLILSRDPIERPLTFGTIGVNGKYGMRIERELSMLDQSFVGSDISTVLSNKDVVDISRIVIFSVPISRAESIIDEVVPFSRPDQLWVDVTSVKEPAVEAMLRSQANVAGFHPVIAPNAKSFRGQTMFIHRARLSPGWSALIDAFLLKFHFKVKEGVSEIHDGFMTIVQGLSHAVILIMAMTIMRLKVKLEESMEYASPFYRIVLSLIGRILGHNLELYAEIQMKNRRTLSMLAILEEETIAFHALIRRGSVDEFVAKYSGVRDYFGKDTIRQSSRLFDELLDLQADLADDNVIVVTTDKDYPGLYHRISGVFADAEINLGISRALGRSKAHFSFVIGGFDIPKTDPRILAAIEHIQEIDGVVKVEA